MLPTTESTAQILSKADQSVQSQHQNRSHDKSDAAADLTRLAAYLPENERILITWVFTDGRTHAEIAALFGHSRRRVGARVERITRRMRDPEFALCALHASEWTRNLRVVAEVCVFAGHPMKHAARELGLSLYNVRRLRSEIAAMARGARLASRLEARAAGRKANIIISNTGGASWRGVTQSVRAAHWRRSA